MTSQHHACMLGARTHPAPSSVLPEAAPAQAAIFRPKPHATTNPTTAAKAVLAVALPARGCEQRRGLHAVPTAHVDAHWQPSSCSLGSSRQGDPASSSLLDKGKPPLASGGGTCQGDLAGCSCNRKLRSADCSSAAYRPGVPPSTPRPLPNESRQAEVSVGLSNSFGFGGHNACIVFRTLEA